MSTVDIELHSSAIMCLGNNTYHTNTSSFIKGVYLLLTLNTGKTQFVLFGRMQFVLKVCSMHEVVVCSTWFSLFYQKTVG